MKRIKPVTRRIPFVASTDETISPKLYCHDLDQTACEVASACTWRNGTCVQSQDPLGKDWEW